MKILVLNPFAGTAREFERCATVARPDTEIVFDTIADTYPLNYVTYIYYRHKCAEAVVERVVRAEQEGFDGVFISCATRFFSTGFWRPISCNASSPPLS